MSDEAIPIIDPGLAGGVALILVSELIVLLNEKGVITAEEARGLVAEVVLKASGPIGTEAKVRHILRAVLPNAL